MQFFQLAYVIKLNLIYSPTIQKKIKIKTIQFNQFITTSIIHTSIFFLPYHQHTRDSTCPQTSKHAIT